MAVADHRGPLPARLAALRDVPAGLMPDERTLREARRVAADVRQQIGRWRAIGEQGRREAQEQARIERVAPAVQGADGGTLTEAAAAAVAVAEADAGPPDSPADEEAAGDPPPDAGTAAQPSPAGTSSATAGRPARGGAHLWVPRELGNAGLVLGLAADGDLGMAHNVSAIARMLNASRMAVRGWIAWLVNGGLLVVVDGFLRPTPDGAAAMRRSDPLPRSLLRRRGKDRLRPKMLRACAAVVRETIGARADRRYVCTDRDRAEDANLDRRIVRRARLLLTEAAIVMAEDVQRGRAGLVRVAAARTERGNPVSAAGRPLSDERQQKLASLAARGRRGGNCVHTVGGNCVHPPIGTLEAKDPMQAPSAPAERGSRSQSGTDGWPEGQQDEPAGVSVPLADPTRRHRRTPAPATEAIRKLVPDLPAAKADRAAQARSSSRKAGAELRRFAADPKAVPKLLRMPRPRAIAQVLAAAQVFDLAPKKRDGLAVQVARVLDPVPVLVLALDVELGRPRNVGVVLLARLKRVLAGEAPGSLLTHCRASWPIRRFLEAVTNRDSGSQRADVASPVPPRRARATAEPHRIGGGSFDDLLRGAGLGEFVARRSTA